jgi:hypothetical protein
VVIAGKIFRGKFPIYLWSVNIVGPVPMVARSKAKVCCLSPAEIVGSNPAWNVVVCREFCVLSGRGLCDKLITRPEEYY